MLLIVHFTTVVLVKRIQTESGSHYVSLLWCVQISHCTLMQSWKLL